MWRTITEYRGASLFDSTYSFQPGNVDFGLVDIIMMILTQERITGYSIPWN